MRRYLAEFIGTFFLVLTISTTVLSGAALAPLAIGAVLAAMIFAGGHVSGAHFNPAVTLAVWIRGRVTATDVPGYLVAQVVGAVLGAQAGRAITGTAPAAALSLSGSQLPAALGAEALMTFALAYVVLNVATSSGHRDNSFYGLAIGFTVLAGATAFGGVSGGVFNPAVAVGVMSVGMISWSMLWVYLVANFAGGLLGGLAFRAINQHEWAPEPGVNALPAPRTDEPEALVGV